jgi:alpha-acetolactate decarboxylase
MIGWHLHFAAEDRARGGHVLALRCEMASLASMMRPSFTSSCPPAVEVHRKAVLDQRRCEGSRRTRDGILAGGIALPAALSSGV